MSSHRSLMATTSLGEGGLGGCLAEWLDVQLGRATNGRPYGGRAAVPVASGVRGFTADMPSPTLRRVASAGSRAEPARRCMADTFGIAWMTTDEGGAMICALYRKESGWLFMAA